MSVDAAQTKAAAAAPKTTTTTAAAAAAVAAAAASVGGSMTSSLSMSVDATVGSIPTSATKAVVPVKPSKLGTIIDSDEEEEEEEENAAVVPLRAPGGAAPAAAMARAPLPEIDVVAGMWLFSKKLICVSGLFCDLATTEQMLSFRCCG
jgi:hypothetical protein